MCTIVRSRDQFSIMQQRRNADSLSANIMSFVHQCHTASHGVPPTHVSNKRITATSTAKQLPSDLGRDLRVWLRAKEQLEHFLLLRRDLCLLVLRKCKEALLPQQCRCAGRVTKSRKVSDELVDNPVRQGVLFEQQGAQEK